MLKRHLKLSLPSRVFGFGGPLSVTAAALLTAKGVSAATGNRNCGVDTFFDWGCDSGNPEQITPLLITIVNWMAIGVSIAVLGGIIYGAILYTTSGGNPEQSKKGLDTIRNSVIGLVLYFIMWAALNFLVPGGILS
ncbi:pilin [Candidatus Saccharibacteria bacterium]|nr:pilin [Candidatus Saccharibacteria bacterium]